MKMKREGWNKILGTASLLYHPRKYKVALAFVHAEVLFPKITRASCFVSCFDLRPARPLLLLPNPTRSKATSRCLGSAQRFFFVVHLVVDAKCLTKLLTGACMDAYLLGGNLLLYRSYFCHRYSIGGNEIWETTFILVFCNFWTIKDTKDQPPTF